MEIYERIRVLRKKHLNLTQTEFGERLGVNRSAINNIEGNRLAKPEQKEPLYRLICKTFNVNYQWLTTGQGSMYIETKETFLEKLSDEYGLSDTARKIIEWYLNHDEEHRRILDGFINSLAVTLADGEQSFKSVSVVDKVIESYRSTDTRMDKATSSKVDVIPPYLDSDEEIEAEVENYRRQLLEEKEAAGKSSALPELKKA